MAISVFLSYSRKDEAAARQLESDLERGRVSVWRDTELRGGDLWWQKILEQIRACDVFVFALSNNGLASKPCRAELAYARDLGVPVLPVQIGPVDSLRTAAVGELQVIEYRQQSGASGIALFAELEEAARRRGPLPDPLPLSPPVPFAYLLRLGSAIEKEQLTPAEQADLVGQLRDCLDTEDDEGVKDDARELLRALRRRPDVTFKHAGEIDLLLAGAPAPRPAEQSTAVSGTAAAGSGPAAPQRSAAPGSGSGTGATAMASAPTGYAPRSGYGPPPPVYAPPPSGPGYPPPGFNGPPGQPTRAKSSRVPMLLLSGSVVIAGLVVGGVLLFGPDDSGPGPGPPGPTTTTQPSPTTTTPPPPTPAEQLLAILPGDVDPGSCSEQPLAGDGDLAALACGQALTQPGPVTTQFALYPSGAVDSVFVADVAGFGVPELGAGQACPDVQGHGPYNTGGAVRGRVACWVGQDNASYLLWTEDEYNGEALVTIPNGGIPGVYVLWNWWVDPGRSSFGP